ncbi:MAG: hypothetical protein MJ249_15925, partial [Kiritimatiellae bacterium]|nr:hypothetical protein [Kiritimatiellia bacterium]
GKEGAQSMSDLEGIIWAAMYKKAGGKGLPDPGSQGFADDVAALFGLKQKTMKDVISGVVLPESELAIWVNAKNHLADNQIAIVRSGNLESGHFVAVKDVPGDAKTGKEITYYNSVGKAAEEKKVEGEGKEKPYRMSEFVSTQDGKRGPDNYIYLFEFPEVKKQGA